MPGGDGGRSAFWPPRSTSSGSSDPGSAAGLRLRFGLAPLPLPALLLIAAGAFMDAQATIDTRPAQMIASQALIGFAGMLFLPPAMKSWVRDTRSP